MLYEVFLYRGSDIRGLTTKDNADDGLPSAILNYANGPSFYQHYTITNDNISRINLTQYLGLGQYDPEFQYPSAAIKDDESHGGEDVPIFAQGPMAHLFQA